MADITLTVGADVDNSFEQFKIDVNTLVDKMNDTPPNVKIGLDKSSITTMKAQIGELVTEIEKAFSSMNTTSLAELNSSMENFTIEATQFVRSAELMGNNFKIVFWGIEDVKSRLDELVKALPKAGSALANMGKEGSIGIDQLNDGLKQMSQLLVQLNSKDFNITQNLSYSSSASKNNTTRLALLKTQAIELNTVVQELYENWINFLQANPGVVGRSGESARQLNTSIMNSLASIRSASGQGSSVLLDSDKALANITSATTAKGVTNVTGQLQVYLDKFMQLRDIMLETGEMTVGDKWTVDMSGLEAANQALADYDSQSEKIRDSFNKTANSASKLSESQAQIVQATEKVSKSQKEAVEATEKLNEAQSETQTQEQTEVDTQSTEKYAEAVTKMCSEIDAKLTELRTKIEQTFDFSTLQLNPDSIYSVIDKIKEELSKLEINVAGATTNTTTVNASGTTTSASASATESNISAISSELKEVKQNADSATEAVTKLTSAVESASKTSKSGKSGTGTTKTKIATGGTNTSDGDVQKLTSDMVAYDNAIKKINTSLQQVITNQRNWTAAQNGSTSGAYQVYQEQEEALRQLLKELESGELTADDFNKRFAEIQATMSSAVTEFTEANSKINLLTEGTQEYNNALDSIARQLNTVVANQAKWSSAAGNSDGAYESYSQLADRLRELDTEVKSGTMSSSEYKTALSAIKAEATGLAPTVKQVAEDLDAQNEKMKNIAAGSTEYKDALVAINTQLKALETSQRKWTTVTSQNNVDASQYSIGAQNAALTQQLEALKTQLDSGNLSMDDYTASLNAIKIATSEYTLSLERAISAIKEKAAAEKEGKSVDQETLATEQQLQSAKKAYQNTLLNATNFLVRYSAAKNSSNESSREAYSAVEKLVGSLRQEYSQMGDTTKSVQQFRASMTSANKTITESTVTLKQNGDATKSLGNRVSKLVSQFSMWFSVSRLVMQSVRAIRELISASIDLDDAMTQLKIVTNETASTYEKFGDQIAETAQKIGASITDLTDSVTTYARLGYSLEESSTLAEYTSMLQNVGDIDVDLAQEAITSMIKAFDLGVDEIESVMDELVAVGKDKVPKRMVTYVKKVAISVKLQRWTRPSKDIILNDNIIYA